MYDENNIQVRRDGLATFLKMVACSTDFFFDRKFFIVKRIPSKTFFKLISRNSFIVDLILQKNKPILSSNKAH